MLVDVAFSDAVSCAFGQLLTLQLRVLLSSLTAAKTQNRLRYQFLADVNLRSRSLYAIAIPSAVCLSSVCHL